MSKAIATIFLAAGLILTASDDALGCVGCKDAVGTGSQNGDATSMGYNWSIMLMLVVPFSLISIGTTMVIRAARRGELPEL